MLRDNTQRSFVKQLLMLLTSSPLLHATLPNLFRALLEVLDFLPTDDSDEHPLGFAVVSRSAWRQMARFRIGGRSA